MTKQMLLYALVHLFLIKYWNTHHVGYVSQNMASVMHLTSVGGAAFLVKLKKNFQISSAGHSTVILMPLI